MAKKATPAVPVIVKLSPFCDKLGRINAVIARLGVKADEYKAELISIAANHPGSVCALEGELFRVAVSFADKNKTDYAAMLAELVNKHGMDAEFLAKLKKKHTATAAGVPTVRVSGRKVARS